MFLYHSKNADPELLEKVLFGRRDTADWLEKIALLFAETGNPTHSLLIGNRGMGKSHLISVLYHRLLKSEVVQKKVVIAYLEEDPYGIADYLDLLRRIIKAIARLEQNPKYKEALNNAHQTLIATSPELRISTAERILLDHLAGRKMLLLVENLNDIFAALGETGQSRWRDFLQNNDNTMICATSQAIFSDLQSRERPFFGFFHITYLKKLVFDEARDLLITLAQEKNNTELIEYLDTDEGQGKLRAVFELTEGNHRLLVTFYDFFMSEFRSELSRTFLHTIDKLKPYYESFLKVLPPQQQKIVQFLAIERIPQSGKAITDNCFLPATTVSKQMSELQRLGYVSGTRHGREAWYEITEPMLRMCLESNENTDGILSIFVDFLGNLYSARDLKISYLRLSLAVDGAEPDLRPKIADEAYFYGKALPRYAKGWRPGEEEIEKLRGLPEEGRDVAIRKMVEDSEFENFNWHSLEFRNLDELEAEINKAFPDRLSFYYWFTIAEIKKGQKRFEDAENAYLKAVKIKPDNAELWNYLGVLLRELNRLEEAKSAVKIALDLKPEWETAWNSLGVVLILQNHIKDAEIAFQKAIELKPDYASAWENLGRLLIKDARIEEAKTALQKYLDLSSDPKKWLRHFISCLHLNDAAWATLSFREYSEDKKSVFLIATLMGLGSWSNKDTIIRVLQHDDFQYFLKSNKEISLPSVIQLVTRGLLQMDMATAPNLHDFHAALTQLYGKKKAFKYPLKFLEVGIRYVKENDPKALLELTLEERRVFEKEILGREPEE